MGRRPGHYGPAVAISDYCVPVSPDDPMLTRIRETVASGDEPDESFFDAYIRWIDATPGAIDMWRLGFAIDALLEAWSRFAKRATGRNPSLVIADGARKARGALWSSVRRDAIVLVDTPGVDDGP